MCRILDEHSRILIGLDHVPHDRCHLVQRQNAKGNAGFIRTCRKQHTETGQQACDPFPHCRSCLYLLIFETSNLVSRSSARAFSSAGDFWKIWLSSFALPWKKNCMIISRGFSALMVFIMFSALRIAALPSASLSYI